MAEFRETSGPPHDRSQSHADRLASFGHCRFNPVTGQLWRGRREVKLTPRAAAVLAVLIEQAGQIVTKQVLNQTVWGGIAVGDDAITSCIQEVRHALGDKARKPFYIETRHRRGYRLIAPVTVALQSAPSPPRQHLVGREEPLTELNRRLELAIGEQRQLVLVSGEPGIGKSALVDFFLSGLAADRGIRIARGQCLHHHGAGEPYLPIIDALTRMASAPDGRDLRKLLAHQAPGWLARMPSLWTRAEREFFAVRGLPTFEHLLSELTLVIEAISRRSPLVVQLEDIHWSDGSTLAWLAHVARRLEPARLLILATMRPVERSGLKVGLDRLVGELALHGQCHEVPLAPLCLGAIQHYLEHRLGNRTFDVRLDEVAERLLARTGGNPLFLAGIVDRLAQADAPADFAEAMASIPSGVRRYIESHVDEFDVADSSPWRRVP